MVTLVESPFPAIFIGIVLLAVLGVALVQTGRGVLVFWMAGVVALTGLMLGGEWLVVTEREEVEQALDGLQAAVVAGDSDAALAYVSPKPDTDRLRALAQTGMQDVNVDTFKIRSLSIEVRSLSGEAVAEFDGTFQGTHRSLGPGTWARRFQFKYRRDSEDGPWLLYEVRHRDLVGPDAPTQPFALPY